MKSWVTWLVPVAASFNIAVALGGQVTGDGATNDRPAGRAALEPDGVDPGAIAAGQAVLAERFAEIAQQGLRVARLDEAEFRQSAALLRAAATLSPAEPRYWRLLTEAELQLGNGDGALSALQGYRKIAPDDRVAQIQLIELHASRMESGDKSLDYLRGILAKETVAAEVRAHVAVLIVQRLLDRGEEAQIASTLDQALKLNPVSVAALELKYELVSGRGSPAERAAGLLALLRANPIRPAAMGELARLLADAGLGKESLEWFDRAARTYAVVGSDDPFAHHDLVLDYAAQVYLAGQTQAARGIVDQLIKADANDVDAWLLRLVIDRGAGDDAAYGKTRKQAEAALWSRWEAVARQIAAPEGQPTGEGPAGGVNAPPAEEPAPPADGGGGGAERAGADRAPAPPRPEAAAVAAQLKAARDDRKHAMFVASAADVAWFQIYFNEQPEEAGKWIDALATLLPADNVTLTRLRGWMRLNNKQPDEARRALDAVKDVDPVSALGLVQIAAAEAGGDPEALKAVDAQARKLLEGHRSGLVGAILAQSLKERGVIPAPKPELAAALRGELQKFPLAWLDIVEEPQRFYSVRAEPLRVAHRYGEPMLVRVVLQNLTDFDITVGDSGVIRSGLWFDAQVQAMRATALPGTAFERLAQSTVLPARQGLAQYVRFDQGSLTEFLSANPSPQLQLTGWCMTNPVSLGEGFGPGPGGFRVPFTRKLSRSGFPVAKPGALGQLVRDIEVGLPDTKVRNLNLMAALADFLLNRQPADGQQRQPSPVAPPADPQRKAIAEQIVAHIAAAAEDEVPAVAAAARFELARVGTPDERAQAVESLLSDTRWEGRLLGLVAARRLGPGRAEDVAAKFAASTEEQPFVKDYAAALLETLQRPPATTQPIDANSPESEPEPGQPADAAATVPSPEGGETKPAATEPGDDNE